MIITAMLKTFHFLSNFSYSTHSFRYAHQNPMVQCSLRPLVPPAVPQAFFPHITSCSRQYHNDNRFSDGSIAPFRPHPFNRRFAFSKKPFFPIEPRNLRLPGLVKRKRRGRGDKSNAKGIRKKHDRPHTGGPKEKTLQGGETPLYKRLPKWPKAMEERHQKSLEPLNLSKLRYFIEKGRLDANFPITQRHIHDSKCCKVKNGVRLFNVNGYPFPYKIDIEVASADQSSIDAIKNVGGSVTIHYLNPLNLRAHVKPYKFEILPKTARPDFKTLLYLEKMRARGCHVRYIKPLWLIEEEQKMKMQLAEVDAIKALDAELPLMKVANEDREAHESDLLHRHRLRFTPQATKQEET